MEGLVLEELGVPGVCAPDGHAGHVHVDLLGTWEAVKARALGLRSVHRVVRPVARLELTGGLEQVQAAMAEVVPQIHELALPTTSFRVSSRRTGSHPFSSEELARVAGAGVRSVVRHPVRMKGFDVEIRCDLRDRALSIGVQLTGSSHSNRQVGPYTQRTSLRANVAWALLQLARPEAPPTRLLDPFVGAGSILLEAGARWPEVQLAGCDRLEDAAVGAAANLAAAGLGGRSEVAQHDARALDQRWPAAHFDTVVTNPPFGVRLGKAVELRAFYRDFLIAADHVATADARLVALVYKREAFNQALSKVRGWRVRDVRILELGGLYVGAFVLERPGS